jgi:hypothetical protein
VIVTVFHVSAQIAKVANKMTRMFRRPPEKEQLVALRGSRILTPLNSTAKERAAQSEEFRRRAGPSTRHEFLPSLLHLSRVSATVRYRTVSSFAQPPQSTAAMKDNKKGLLYTPGQFVIIKKKRNGMCVRA